MLPVRLIFGAVDKAAVAKHAVMLAFHLVQTIAQRGQKIVIGCQNQSVWGEFDHRHRPIDGVELGLTNGFGIDLFGNVGGKLDIRLHRPVAVQHGVVSGFQPDHLASGGLAFDPTAEILAPAQTLPKALVVRVGNVFTHTKQAVRLAQHLGFAAVAQCTQEVAVGRQHLALMVKTDDRGGTVQRSHHGMLLLQFLLCTGVGLLESGIEHGGALWQKIK